MQGTGITLLLHETTYIGRIKIFGSPYLPYIREGFAYQMEEDDLKEYWAVIPEDTQLLITHTPPKGILDGAAQFGSENLRQRVEEISPFYHVFGHVHADHGIKTIAKTKYVNASVIRQLEHFDYVPDIFEI